MNGLRRFDELLVGPNVGCCHPCSRLEPLLQRAHRVPIRRMVSADIVSGSPFYDHLCAVRVGAQGCGEGGVRVEDPDWMETWELKVVTSGRALTTTALIPHPYGSYFYETEEKDDRRLSREHETRFIRPRGTDDRRRTTELRMAALRWCDGHDGSIGRSPPSSVTTIPNYRSDNSRSLIYSRARKEVQGGLQRRQALTGIDGTSPLSSEGGVLLIVGCSHSLEIVALVPLILLVSILAPYA